ncbi:MAG: hypothetical protein KDK36_02735, partial [Leptospiraceae bacterium]|nr:hypothetical protein [Leptospiraceae bacterium]
YLIMLILPNLGLEKRSVACDLASVFLLVNMFMFTLNFLPGKSKIQGIQTYKDGSVLLTVLFWDESEIQKRQDSIDLTKSFFLVRNEKWKEAEILFEKLKDKFPDLNYINFYLGILNLQKTNFKEAKVYFEKVSEPDPQYYYPALMNIAYLSIYNEFEINKALEYSKIAYDKLNDFSSIPYVSILFRAGKNDQAKEILFDYYKRNNTKLTTHHKALYLLLAYAYQLEGNNLKSEEFKNLALNEEMIYELTIKYTKFIYSLANWDFEKDHPNV